MPVEEVVEIIETPEIEPSDGLEPVEPLEPAEPELEVAEVKGDERLLPADIKALRDINPKAFRAAKDAFFGKRAYDDLYADGGLPLAQKFAEWFAGRGGIEGATQQIQQMESKGRDFDAFTGMAKDGDTRLIDAVLQESGDNAQKFVAYAAQKYREMDPEGYNAQTAGIFDATIRESGVMGSINNAIMALKYGATDDAVANLQAIQGWLNGWGQVAKAPRQQSTQPQRSQVNQREQELNTREQQMFRSDYDRDANAWRDGEIATALADYIKREPGNADKKADATELVIKKAEDMLAQDKTYQANRDNLLQRRDKDGAMRVFKAKMAQAVKDVAPRVGRSIYGVPTQAKPALVPERKPAVRTSTLAPKDPYKAIFDRAQAR